MASSLFIIIFHHQSANFLPFVLLAQLIATVMASSFVHFSAGLYWPQFLHMEGLKVVLTQGVFDL